MEKGGGSTAWVCLDEVGLDHLAEVRVVGVHCLHEILRVDLQPHVQHEEVLEEGGRGAPGGGKEGGAPHPGGGGKGGRGIHEGDKKSMRLRSWNYIHPTNSIPSRKPRMVNPPVGAEMLGNRGRPPIAIK